MRRANLVVVILCLMLAALPCVVSCISGARRGQDRAAARREWTPPHPVTIEGQDACYDLLPCGGLLPLRRRGDRAMRVMARDGDVLTFGVDEEEPWLFPYRDSDGLTLSFKREDFRLSLRGKTVSLILHGEDSWKWLKKADAKDLEHLRSLTVGKDVNSCRTPLIRKLAQVNPNIALCIEQPSELRQVLPLFKPWFLFVGGEPRPLAEEDVRLISSKKELEVLWLDAKELKTLQFLSKLPNLRKLLIADWDPEATGPLPKECLSLRSLSILGSELKDLSPVAHLAGLEELHLVNSDELKDVGALSRFSNLRWLTLLGCAEVSDISALHGLKKLRCLGLPSEVSQDDFKNVIDDHPSLYLLQLGCDNVSDLSPLTRLKKLEGLVLIEMEKVNYSPLHRMKNLRYLVLSGKPRENFPEEVKKLEEALPQCAIMEGKICLGSGWILVLLPVMVFSLFLGARGRNRLCR